MVGLVGYFDIKEYSDMVETKMTDDCDVESHEETVCEIREKESCKIFSYLTDKIPDNLNC